MPNFLVETYTPGSAGLSELVEAAKAVARPELAIRYVDSIYAPEDETCFHVFEATSIADLSEAARNAGLPCQRIVEVFSEEGPARHGARGSTRPANAAARQEWREA